MMKSIKWISMVAALLAAQASTAMLIVDTGASPNVGSADPGISVENDGSYFGYQFVAGRFETTEAYQITSLSAFVRNYACCSTQDMQFHLGIASGPTDPSHASFLDFAPAEQASIQLNSGAAGWGTATISDLLLPAGTWWLVISQTETDLGSGLGLPGGVPNPMDAYAAITSPSGGFSGSDGWNLVSPNLGGTRLPSTFGFRIEGDAVQVPLPATAWLMLIGVVGLLLAHRHRSSRLQMVVHSLST